MKKSLYYLLWGAIPAGIFQILILLESFAYYNLYIARGLFATIVQIYAFPASVFGFILYREVQSYQDDILFCIVGFVVYFFIGLVLGFIYREIKRFILRIFFGISDSESSLIIWLILLVPVLAILFFFTVVIGS